MKRIRLISLMLAGVLAFAGCTSASQNDASASAASSNASSRAAASSTGSASESASSQDSPENLDYSQTRVSYLGPQGTYTQEACARFFNAQGTYLPCENVAASIATLVVGDSDFAVIPQENTIGGPVSEYLDEVIAHENVSVVGEVELPITQNILAKPEATYDDITVVYSHKQGIAQGKAWVEANLPNAQLVEVSSTAEGARKAAESEGLQCAAIGSASAAELYGLTVLAPSIQMNDDNVTRFYVLSTEAPNQKPADRMVFVATGPASQLTALLNEASAAGLSIVAVHDRPEKTQLGNYHYLIECEGGGYDAFKTLSGNKAFSLRYLGSFALR